jgi:hypothetical protein
MLFRGGDAAQQNVDGKADNQSDGQDDLAQNHDFHDVSPLDLRAQCRERAAKLKFPARERSAYPFRGMGDYHPLRRFVTLV